MKFIADAMLGKLAKWLRIMGFDVLYFPGIEDRKLVKIAREEDRTILTRDTGLIRRKGLRNPVFIHSDDVSEQLDQMKPLLDRRDAQPLGRCELCNGLLRPVEDRQAIRELVPEFVYLNATGFARCLTCGKIYWQGSHSAPIQRMKRKVLDPARACEGRN